MITNQEPILLFDGVCNLCHNTVQFIIAHDKVGKFRFASLQSDIGQQLLRRHEVKTEALQSAVLLLNGQHYVYSDAALEVARHLDGAWSWLYIFKIIPSFIRNAIYHIVARNRYRWFGQKEQCWIPTPDLKARFLS
jgi:predicted DCC family thiol-disulfide oxidoreductase YuxK